MNWHDDSLVVELDCSKQTNIVSATTNHDVNQNESYIPILFYFLGGMKSWDFSEKEKSEHGYIDFKTSSV